MASRLRENTANLARIERALEVLVAEANQPFLDAAAATTLSTASELLQTKADWLKAQIQAETPLEVTA